MNEKNQINGTFSKGFETLLIDKIQFQAYSQNFFFGGGGGSAGPQKSRTIGSNIVTKKQTNKNKNNWNFVVIHLHACYIHRTYSQNMHRGLPWGYMQMRYLICTSTTTVHMGNT